MDVIEINEAFAQALACIKLKLEDNDPRINPNGVDIALGHPLGMYGIEIIQSATNELIRKNKRYALITMCVGVGQGYATIIEKNMIYEFNGYKPVIHPSSFVHKEATVIGNVIIGENVYTLVLEHHLEVIGGS